MRPTMAGQPHQRVRHPPPPGYTVPLPPAGSVPPVAGWAPHPGGHPMGRPPHSGPPLGPPLGPPGAPPLRPGFQRPFAPPMIGGGAALGVPLRPPVQERDLAIASAVATAAAKAASEWDEAESRRAKDAKMAARRAADEAAEAVEAQAKLCEEADAALRQAVAKLEELERVKQQAHTGLPMLHSGTAKRWNPQKGFGFIVPRGGEGSDLFCHTNDILDGVRLPDGAPVRYVQCFDERKQKYYAAEVTGGAPAAEPEAGEEESRGDGKAGSGWQKPKRQRALE